REENVKLRFRFCWRANRPASAILSEIKAAYRFSPLNNILLGQFRENWHGGRFRGSTFRLRKIADTMPEIRKALLPVQRNGIVNGMANLLVRQVSQQIGAPFGTDHVLMPSVMVLHAGLLPRLFGQPNLVNQVREDRSI